LDSRSRVTVPAEVRRQLRLEAGDEILYEIRDGDAVLRNARTSGLAQLAAFAGPEWRGYADQVQRDRDEWDR
jgi:AbrB family looped-hinge helix DNA binding protein